jgi:hypothetical protein
MPTEVLSKETYLVNILLASQFIRKFQNYYLTRTTWSGGQGTGLPSFMNSNKMFCYASKFSGKLGAI